MINVICVKQGDRYDHVYPNRLKTMVERNLSIPHNFYCYTDNDYKVDCNIIHMPDDGLELWWPKLRMFEEGFGGLEGRCLFFDLDVVIQKDITFLLDYEEFHMIQTYWKFGIETTYESGMKQKQAYDMNKNSSCLLWTAGENAHIWEYFWKNPEYYMLKYAGIDRFMHHEGLTHKVFPEGIFYSRKHGIKYGDMPLNEPPWYKSDDHAVCLMNGMHKLDKEYFDKWNPYEGYEQYYL